MALREFVDLGPANLALAQAAERQVDPLTALIQGFQLPQQIKQEALNQQLSTAINQAKLQQLQQPEIITADGNVFIRDPSSPNGIRSIFTRPTTTRSPFTQQQVVSLTDPSDVRFALPDESGRPPAGYQFAKGMEAPPKPIDKLQAKKFIRDVYEDTSTKIAYFGKGELPGSYEIKNRLDAVLKGSGGDFNKLNPQAKSMFIFAMNNLKDPRSATLLQEANQIAQRMGLADRFGAYVQNLKTGDNVSPQIAKEIYDVISQTKDFQENIIVEDLINRKAELEAIGSKLTEIGVPKFMVDKVSARERQLQSGAQPPPSNINPSAQPTVQPTIREQQRAAAPTPAPATTKPTSSGIIKIIAPNGRRGDWDANKPIPPGYTRAP